MYIPNVEGLLRRPVIRQPQEEFTLPPPPAPTPPNEPPLPVTPETDFIPLLQEEAAELQEILEIIEANAPDVSVAVPEEEQALLGRTVISAQDYLGSLRDPQQAPLRSRFEQGVLGNVCGPNQAWPLLTAFDLTYLRDSLLATVSVVEGQIYRETVNNPKNPSTSGIAWGRDWLNSHAPKLAVQQVQQSRRYRDAFWAAVQTSELDMRSNLLRCLFEPSIYSQIGELRENLAKLVVLLRQVREFFCLMQLMELAANFHQLQGALLQVLKTLVLQQALQVLSTLFSSVISRVVTPVLEGFSGSLGGNHSPLACMGDAVSEEIADLVSIGSTSIIGYYQSLVADLLREEREKADLMVKKVGVLGTYSKLGRYMQHLEQGILLIEGLQQTLLSPLLVQQQLEAFLNRQVEPATDRLFDALRRSRGYRPPNQAGENPDPGPPIA